MMYSVFCGCSYVQGIGLDQESHAPDLWVNLVHGQLLNHTVLRNLGRGAATNKDIFIQAMNIMLDLKDQCRYLVVAWTNTKRIKVNPAVETYNTELYLENCAVPDLDLNPNFKLLGSYVENIRDRFFDLQHYHYDILEILKCSSLLDLAAQAFGIQIFFVNSLLRMDQNYFIPVTDSDRLPSHTTKFTQNLLNVESRDDEEYFILYDRIHQDYADTQGLNLSWINLDQGIRTNFYVDKGNDQLHPGILSNRMFAQYAIEKMQNML